MARGPRWGGEAVLVEGAALDVDVEAGDFLVRQRGEGIGEAELVPDFPRGGIDAVAADLGARKGGAVQQRDAMTGAGEDERGEGTGRRGADDDDVVGGHFLLLAAKEPEWKRSFADKCVPKCNFGTRKSGSGRDPNPPELNDAGFFERLVRAVLGQRLERAGGQLDRDVALQFGDEDALFLQVRLEDAGRVGGDVRTDTALFLGFTAAEDAGADDRAWRR